MTILIIILLLGLAGFAGLINNATARSIQMLLQPGTMLTGIETIDNPEYQADMDSFGEWAENNGFDHDCYFRFETMDPDKPIFCSAWWSDMHKTWALAYCAARLRNIDFVTQYSARVGVTTASSKDAMMLPDRPGIYRQSFLNRDPSALYRLHLTARALVERHEGVSLAREKGDLLTLIENALLNQGRFLTALPFWRWRGFFWFVWRRNFLVNRPVAIQEGS